MDMCLHPAWTGGSRADLCSAKQGRPLAILRLPRVDYRHFGCHGDGPASNLRRFQLRMELLLGHSQSWLGDTVYMGGRCSIDTNCARKKEGPSSRVN